MTRGLISIKFKISKHKLNKLPACCENFHLLKPVSSKVISHFTTTFAYTEAKFVLVNSRVKLISRIFGQLTEGLWVLVWITGNFLVGTFAEGYVLLCCRLQCFVIIEFTARAFKRSSRNLWASVWQLHGKCILFIDMTWHKLLIKTSVYGWEGF